MLHRIGSIEDGDKESIVDQIINEFDLKYVDIEGEAYLGYPIYIDEIANRRICVDLALVTRIGIFIFNILLDAVTDYCQIQDEIYMKVKAKFEKQPFLVKKRELIFKFYTITYSVEKIKIQEDNLIGFSVKNIIDIIDEYKEDSVFSDTKYNNILSGIQEAYGINNRIERSDAENGTKAFYINQMNSLIEKYDGRQMEAILADTRGIQRIRGMAGSGKTIVLARKAVELHMAHKEWTIVVTYSTRSLKNQLVNLISKFYAAKNDGSDYDRTKIRVMQAWGSSNAIGVYYDICLKHGVSPWNFTEAKNKYGKNRAFSKVCEMALKEISIFSKMYDCILIDEAQDFDKNFMSLCLKILGDEQRLVYAYDELQKLNEETMPTPIEIFGQDISKDTPLTVCYRNQGPAIVTAHAIGMGLYRKNEGLLQIPGSADVWNAIGYSSDEPIQEGKSALLYRTEETSPVLLKVDSNEIIDFLSYNNFIDLRLSLLEMLKRDIKEEHLLPSDIMIIDMDGIESSQNRDILMNLLYADDDYEDEFMIHSAGTTSPEDFFRKNSIVYTSIFRAKGNETFMVYIVNAQKCINSLTPRSDRNALFTAITRSKGWVRVLGYGDEMRTLCEEFNEIRSNEYKLKFDKYPTKEEQNELILNNKDLDDSIMKTIGNTRNMIKKLRNEENITDARLIMELLGISTKEELLRSLSEEEEY
ncbi:DEAD/DEAH box helicase [Lacrimispora sp.]|uniref:DEAD/DEAH box helicase n=1 Tax=Lacrimispora sp. TaxID=2719234 RepID=UPI0028B2106E|nr:ATP-binding domain-containing protein [Lacrimispora sp.]